MRIKLLPIAIILVLALLTGSVITSPSTVANLVNGGSDYQVTVPAHMLEYSNAGLVYIHQSGPPHCHGIEIDCAGQPRSCPKGTQAGDPGCNGPSIPPPCPVSLSDGRPSIHFVQQEPPQPCTCQPCPPPPPKTDCTPDPKTGQPRIRVKMGNASYCIDMSKCEGEDGSWTRLVFVGRPPDVQLTCEPACKPPQVLKYDRASLASGRPESDWKKKCGDPECPGGEYLFGGACYPNSERGSSGLPSSVSNPPFPCMPDDNRPSCTGTGPKPWSHTGKRTLCAGVGQLWGDVFVPVCDRLLGVD